MTNIKISLRIFTLIAEMRTHIAEAQRIVAEAKSNLLKPLEDAERIVKKKMEKEVES